MKLRSAAHREAVRADSLGRSPAVARPAATTVVALAALGPNLVLAPERYVANVRRGQGASLGSLVTERRVSVVPDAEPGLVVCDTSHARDGRLDVASAVRDGAGTRSAKKLACSGDLLVSRLRPYLRQIALVHPDAFVTGSSSRSSRRKELAVSTEFFVLASADPKTDLAFLLPYLLSAEVQSVLAAAQEGGHHPRVPLESLLALRVPDALVRDRAKIGRTVRARLAEFYRADRRLRAVLVREP